MSDTKSSSAIATSAAGAAAPAAAAAASSSSAAAADIKFDYDLIVIGGGSGGLAAAKEAAKLKAKVALFDYIKPSPQGTTWGLGGTCVNVGCIPKKLMHYSGLLRKGMEDSKELGWSMKEEPQFSWESLSDSVGKFIRGLNFQYRMQLRSEKVNYINAYATFQDAHTVTFEDPKTKKPTKLTARNVLVAVGGRPRLPMQPSAKDFVPGAKEFGISSDDIFWWKKSPGKTLVVGASYIALECGGFLNELGYDVTVMVRSILLRGFDQQISNMIGELLEVGGVRFIRPATVSSLTRPSPSDKITVTYVREDTKASHTEQFDTVLFAMGRDPCTSGIGLDRIGVKLDAATGKIVVSDTEQTSVSNVYAIGDCIVDRPELTPVAIQAGVLLARRLFAGASQKMNYNYIPTTVFTPVEYGSVGMAEETAQKVLGKENVETYLSRYGALETAASHPTVKRQVKSYEFHPKDEGAEGWEDKILAQANCAKLVIDKRNGRVVGFHFVGANAGEVTQGFALAVKLGATKADFDSLVGIHPTAAEEFTLLKTTGSSGADYRKQDGC